MLPKTGLELVSQLDREQECTADPQQPLQKIVGVYEHYSNVSQLFHLPKTIDANQALVCTFQTNQAYGKHFAHAMQQLYGCFSFYQQYPFSSRKVLVLPPQLQTQLGTNPFLNGFFRFLQDELKVEFLGPNGVQDMEYVSPADTFTPGGYHISHTAELNRQIQSFLSLQDDPHEVCRGDEIAPRFGILNRRPAVGRSIQNTANVVTVLQDLSWNMTVSVQYFEGTSFADQVEFFRGIDILLAPHGAQNTGIPFMANKKCSHLVEVFPENYLLPTFYGSLARNAGIGYAYLYLSRTSMDGSLSRKEDSTLEGRVQARAVNLCLEPDAIRESVASLVDDWKACCRRP